MASITPRASSTSPHASLLSNIRRLMPLITFLAALLIGGVFLVHTPQGQTPDVWSHTYRISAIVNGSPTHHVDAQSDFHRSAENVGGHVGNAWIQYSIDHFNGYDTAVVNPQSITVQDKNGADVPFNNTAINAPPVYLPQIIGFWLGKVLALSTNTTYYLAETLTLLLYAFAMGASVAVLPQWRIVVGCVLTLTAYSGFAISADPMTQAVATLFICLLYRTTQQRVSTRYCIVLSVTGLFLSMCKLTYMPLTVLTLLVPWLQHGFMVSANNDQTAMTREKARQRTQRYAGISVIGVICSATWIISWMHHINWFTVTPVFVTLAETKMRTHDLLTDPHVMAQALGSIGYAIIHAQVPFDGRKLVMAAWFLLLCLFVVLLATTFQRRSRNRQLVFWWAAFGCSIGIMLLIYLALWLQCTKNGFVGINGFQFRYFLPMLALWSLCGLSCVKSVMSR